MSHCKEFVLLTYFPHSGKPDFAVAASACTRGVQEGLGGQEGVSYIGWTHHTLNQGKSVAGCFWVYSDLWDKYSKRRGCHSRIWAEIDLNPQIWNAGDTPARSTPLI